MCVCVPCLCLVSVSVCVSVCFFLCVFVCVSVRVRAVRLLAFDREVTRVVARAHAGDGQWRSGDSRGVKVVRLHGGTMAAMLSDAVQRHLTT